MRYDLTEREAALMRQRITAETLATVAKQGVLEGIIAGIPDAPIGATFGLRETPDGGLYLESVEAGEPPLDAAALIDQQLATLDWRPDEPAGKNGARKGA